MQCTSEEMVEKIESEMQQKYTDIIDIFNSNVSTRWPHFRARSWTDLHSFIEATVDKYRDSLMRASLVMNTNSVSDNTKIICADIFIKACVATITNKLKTQQNVVEADWNAPTTTNVISIKTTNNKDYIIYISLHDHTNNDAITKVENDDWLNFVIEFKALDTTKVNQTVAFNSTAKLKDITIDFISSILFE